MRKIGLLFLTLLLGAYAQAQIPFISDTESSANDLLVQSENAIRIVSEDIDESGIASAYMSHVFKIEAENLSIQNPKWTLELTLSDGSIESIPLQDNNLECSTSPINDVSLYKISQDKNIEGAINFSCGMDGREIHADPYKIAFDVKPIIEYAVIDKIVDNSPFVSYNAHLSVKYYGAKRIYMSVEEEYGTNLMTIDLNTDVPNIATGVATYIKSPYLAWIDITAKNEYGKAEYTIELGPYGEVLYAGPANGNNGSTSYIETVDVDIDCYEVYDIRGIKIGTFDSLDAVKERDIKGIYIVNFVKNGKVVKTVKCM